MTDEVSPEERSELLEQHRPLLMAWFAAQEEYGETSDEAKKAREKLNKLQERLDTDA